MNAFKTLLLWVGTGFTTEIYMISTKIQGIAWSIADIVLVFILLKIVDLVRQSSGKKRIFYRYLLLLVSAVLTPSLLFTQTARQIFILESIICGMQFAILVYTVIAERKDLLHFVKELAIAKGNE